MEQVQGGELTCSWKAVACSGKPASVKYSTTSITVHSTGSAGFSLRPELYWNREKQLAVMLLRLLHTLGHHHSVSNTPTYGQPKGVPSAPGRAGFPGGKGTGDGESGPVAAEAGKEKASACGFVLGLSPPHWASSPTQRDPYLIPLPYSWLPWRTPGGCHCPGLAPALHPGPGGVHTVSTL